MLRLRSGSGDLLLSLGRDLLLRRPRLNSVRAAVVGDACDRSIVHYGLVVYVVSLVSG